MNESHNILPSVTASPTWHLFHPGWGIYWHWIPFVCLFDVTVYVFLHVYTFVCTYIDMCVYVCSGVRGHHCVLLTPSLLNFSKEGLSMNPELSYTYWPVRPMDPPASTSQWWSYRHAPPCLALVWVPASTSGLHIWVENMYWLSRRTAASAPLSMIGSYVLGSLVHIHTSTAPCWAFPPHSWF